MPSVAEREGDDLKWLKMAQAKFVPNLLDSAIKIQGLSPRAGPSEFFIDSLLVRIHYIIAMIR